MTDYAVPMSAEVSDRYLYLSIGTRLIGVPLDGLDLEKIDGINHIADAVRSQQVPS